MARAHQPPVDPALEDDMDEHVRWALAQWPEIDPEVEGIVTRIDKVERYLQQAAIASLARVELSYEAFKVLIALRTGQRSHGALCRELLVSTGAMTNRLDKLEQAGLLERRRDPHDRRGVLLALTAAGRAKLDNYIALGAERERQLLGILALDEKQDLNRLLRKLLIFLRAEVGQAPPRTAGLTPDR